MRKKTEAAAFQAESTVSAKGDANSLLQSKLGKCERKKAHLKDTSLVWSLRLEKKRQRGTRGNNTPRHKKTLRLKLRQTPTAEHQKGAMNRH